MPGIVWNGSPLTLRHGGSSDKITYHGGGTWNRWYQNLPSFLSKNMPLYGTHDINTGDKNTLVIPAKTNVYLFRVHTWAGVDLTGWTELSTGPYLKNDPKVKLYKKTFEAGEYVIDNHSAMYLFEPGRHDYKLIKGHLLN